MILPLSSLVTSRELSERMVKLGAPTETQFYWYRIANEKDWFIGFVSIGAKMEMDDVTYDYTPAYLSGEVGEMLPKWLDNDQHKCLQQYWKQKSNHQCNCAECALDKSEKLYIDVGYYGGGIHIPDWETENEAEARGLTWCHLKEQGLIK